MKYDRHGGNLLKMSVASLFVLKMNYDKKKSADRNQEIEIKKSMPPNQSRNTRSMREEKKFRIPLNSRKKQTPTPSRPSQTCPNRNVIQKRKKEKT